LQLELPIDAKNNLEVRFLLGPAGSGKTWQCLEEIRRALMDSPKGAPLIFLAPRQSTFQLEYQLLQEGSLKGYNRLRIFSFDRLAHFVFEKMGVGAPDLLSEQGRVMVLRALLNEQFNDLSIFRSCARRIGFADELSGQIREFQAHGLLPDDLRNWATQGPRTERLRAKLADLALLYEHYRAWLQKNDLQDGDSILGSASELLEKSKAGRDSFTVAGLYLDGFAQLTPEERRFLFALLPRCERSTMAICLDADITKPPLRSSWSLAFKMFNECVGLARDRFGAGAVKVTALSRKRADSRIPGAWAFAG